MPVPDPGDLLADLDPAQREAVTITSGPLCILAGAGSGKTRVISRRVAYALASGVVRPRDVLVVTFTDKAASEMRGRLAALGQPGVAASTFHAASLRQLRHFWPRVHGTDPPAILRSRCRSSPLGQGLPGGYRYLAVRDLAGRSMGPRRRIKPAGTSSGDRRGRDASLPPDLMAACSEHEAPGIGPADRLRGHARADDRLIDASGRCAEVRDRYRWFSVDECQDTNPLRRRFSSVAGWARRPAWSVTRTDHLHLHRGDERVPDLVRRPLSAARV
jgi:DNA helicase-2/ATP-dependent DNA helicase PcrA